MPSSGVSSGLSKLTLDSQKSKSKSKQPVADSWEDEDAASDSEAPPPPAVDSGAKAPPPTPISPTHQSSGITRQWASMSPDVGPRLGPHAPLSPDAERRRPEKTDAVARRMIAGALGVKAPKMTEEQRAYEKSVREQERKRRDAEREREKREQEEAERAKIAIWED
ncbi:hypothetical protein ACHAQH_005618 [Verticillium albo-atrum]